MTNPLADCGLPRFFALKDGAERLSSGAPVSDGAVRFFGRSLTGMQKEALVCSSDGSVWRLSSDEGAYLNGLDEAPCPLAFMTTGMAASFMHAIQAHLTVAGASTGGVRLIQDNYYTMQGSIPRRTMIGGAKPVDLQVEIAGPGETRDMELLVAAAVESAAANSLLRTVLRNTFSLTVNGREVEVDAATHPRRPPHSDPRSVFEGPLAHQMPDEPLVERLGMTPLTNEATSHGGSSYAPEQHRTLHLRGICAVRADGVKVIEQHLYNPHGSIFRLLSDESPRNGGLGRAPDANAYMSAGIGFCFMTQFGRFAKIVGKRLDGYRIVQDTRFVPGHTDPLHTNVYLDTPETEDFAREVVDMGERTCFLHALCRSELAAYVRVVTANAIEGSG